MKFCAIVAGCMLLIGCTHIPENVGDQIILVHYVEDSLSQYVYADSTDHPRWTSGFRDTVPFSNVKNEWSYPGNWAYDLISVEKLQGGDFLYKCPHDLYVGYPFNFAILTGVGCCYKIRWEDVAKSNHNEAEILSRKPIEYYIEIDSEMVKKYNRYENITSGEQLVKIISKMMEDGSLIESIKLIGSCQYSHLFSVETYRQYAKDYQNGLVDDDFPILDWLQEE